MTRTSTEWLALGDELGVELAEVLTPKDSWNHDLSQNDSDGVTLCYCSKCDRQWYIDDFPERKYCPVPDPITIDWNTAMEWMRKSDRHKFSEAFEAVFCETHESQSIGRMWWMQFYAQPKHYLIAAARSKI